MTHAQGSALYGKEKEFECSDIAYIFPCNPSYSFTYFVMTGDVNGDESVQKCLGSLMVAEQGVSVDAVEVAGSGRRRACAGARGRGFEA